jgi:hypothetical protein
VLTWTYISILNFEPGFYFFFSSSDKTQNSRTMMNLIRGKQPKRLQCPPKVETVTGPPRGGPVDYRVKDRRARFQLERAGAGTAGAESERSERAPTTSTGTSRLPISPPVPMRSTTRSRSRLGKSSHWLPRRRLLYNRLGQTSAASRQDRYQSIILPLQYETSNKRAFSWTRRFQLETFRRSLAEFKHR